MKRIFAVLVLAAMLLCFVGCGTTNLDADTPKEDPAATITTLKVLAIGNSFSVDAMEHLYAVAKAEGVEEIVLGNLYIGGCALSKHWNNAQLDAAAYVYYKNTTGEWVKMQDVTLKSGLQDEQWDLITFQQASPDSGVADSYTVLQKLVDYVNENKTNPNAKFAWHMTWAYQSNSTHSAFPKYGNSQQAMYMGIVNAVQQMIIPMEEISLLLPVGTAIQNARAGVFGDALTRDGYHLNETGRVIASYTWYAAINGQPLQTINLTGVVGVPSFSDAQKEAIVNAVNAAIAHPFEITKAS